MNTSAGHIIPGWEPAEEPEEPPTAEAPEPTHAEQARTLIAGHSRGALSTIAVDPPGTPFGSVVTYAADELGRPMTFVSTLAEHTHNLRADPRASLLVVEDVPAGSDPLAAGRVTLLGVVQELSDDVRDAAKEAYLAANPNAFYVGYGDFVAVRLDIGSVRYVGGFGRMSWIDPADYAVAEPDPLAPHAAGIVGHMNADHAEALVLLSHHRAGRMDVTGARMTGVDRYGIEVVADVSGARRQAAFRIGFRTQQVTPDAVRRELVALLREARSAAG
ncbi:MAG: HugZ family protein [Acidimicrobiales bacterium]